MCFETLWKFVKRFHESVSMPKYLSGEELLVQSKRPSELPGRGGFKDHEPDGSWLQKMKLDKFHEERYQVLSEERVEKLGSLSTGIWNQEQGKVLVTKNTGKFWKNMGHCIGGEKLLHPEEAVFLVDQGIMELTCEGRPMSLQEVYHRLLPTNESRSGYFFCSHLMRLGFIVRRAEQEPVCIDSVSDDMQRNAGDDMISHDVDQTRKHVKDHLIDNLISRDNDHTKKRQRDDGDFANDERTISCAKKLKSDAELSEDQASDKTPINSMSPDPFDILGLDIESISVDIASLSQALPGLELTRPLDFDVSNQVRVLKIIGKDFYESPKSQMKANGENKIGNWQQWKSMSRKEKILQTRARILWEGDDDDDDEDVIHPVHDFNVVCSPEETMERIRRIQETSSEETSNIESLLPRQDLNPDMFDIFPPDSKFKKSSPGSPLATAVVVRAESRPPLGCEALKLIGKARKRGGSLMFGIEDGGEVTFLSCNLVSLPNLI